VIFTNVYRNVKWLTDNDGPKISGGMHRNPPCTVLREGLCALPAAEWEGVH
jgi:hypothetical protein